MHMSIRNSLGAMGFALCVTSGRGIVEGQNWHYGKAEKQGFAEVVVNLPQESHWETLIKGLFYWG